MQHTSRDGDMQLHVHSQIAHVVRTATDGKWRAPDSLGARGSSRPAGLAAPGRLHRGLAGAIGLPQPR